ncbi:hypothetical protein HN51_010592 [Arachis hypogaea]
MNHGIIRDNIPMRTLVEQLVGIVDAAMEGVNREGDGDGRRRNEEGTSVERKREGVKVRGEGEATKDDEVVESGRRGGEEGVGRGDRRGVSRGEEAERASR